MYIQVADRKPLANSDGGEGLFCCRQIIFNSRQRHNFEQKIESIRQSNPNWAVVIDWTKPGEKEAFVILRKDKDYAYRRAAYQATSALKNSFLKYSDRNLNSLLNSLQGFRRNCAIGTLFEINFANR